jgi:hypothetical protein
VARLPGAAWPARSRCRTRRPADPRDPDPVRQRAAGAGRAADGSLAGARSVDDDPRAGPGGRPIPGKPNAGKPRPPCAAEPGQARAYDRALPAVRGRPRPHGPGGGRAASQAGRAQRPLPRRPDDGDPGGTGLPPRQSRADARWPAHQQGRRRLRLHLHRGRDQEPPRAGRAVADGANALHRPLPRRGPPGPAARPHLRCLLGLDLQGRVERAVDLHKSLCRDRRGAGCQVQPASVPGCARERPTTRSTSAWHPGCSAADSRTTERHYIHAQALIASRRYNGVVLPLRDAAVAASTDQEDPSCA